MSSQSSNREPANGQKKPWSRKWKLVLLALLFFLWEVAHLGGMSLLIYYDYLDLGKKSVGFVERMKSVATKMEKVHQCPRIVSKENPSVITSEMHKDPKLDPEIEHRTILPESMPNISSERRTAVQTKSSPSPKPASKPKKG